MFASLTEACMFAWALRRRAQLSVGRYVLVPAACACAAVLLTQAVPDWWVLPIAGTVIGYATNWLAISMIFEPVELRRIGRFTWHGLFLRRQDAASDVYAHIIADEIVTVANIGQELMEGPRSDRTRAMISAALRPAIDRAVRVPRAR